MGSPRFFMILTAAFNRITRAFFRRGATAVPAKDVNHGNNDSNANNIITTTIITIIIIIILILILIPIVQCY